MTHRRVVANIIQNFKFKKIGEYHVLITPTLHEIDPPTDDASSQQLKTMLKTKILNTLWEQGVVHGDVTTEYDRGRIVNLSNFLKSGEGSYVMIDLEYTKKDPDNVPDERQQWEDATFPFAYSPPSSPSNPRMVIQL